MAKIRVMLVDDHQVIRKGLRFILEDDGEIEVVGEASTGEEAVKLASKHKPDIILMDLSLPGIDGITAIKKIKELNPRQLILTLTMHEDPVFLEKVLNAGGDGFVLKRAADIELLSAIKVVYRGEVYIDIGLQRHLVNKAIGITKCPNENEELDNLTGRENEVLRLVALGYSNMEIANSLCISIKTVENHKSKIKEKLGTSSRSKLVLYAKKRGLV